MTPADELRAAAENLRRLATEATPGPWHAVQYDPSWAGDFDAGVSTTPNGDLDVIGHGYEGGGVDRIQDARYIAAMHPGVGKALADWLDEEARRFEASVQAADGVFRDDPAGRDAFLTTGPGAPSVPALAAARAINQP